MLLVHGLLADAEEECDLLPGPAVRPGVIDLKCLKALGKLAERAGGPQSLGRITAAGSLRQRNPIAHVVNVG